jgi:hypothetical protein
LELVIFIVTSTRNHPDSILQRFKAKQRIAAYFYDFNSAWYAEGDWIEASEVFIAQTANLSSGFVYDSEVVSSDYAVNINTSLVPVRIMFPLWDYGIDVLSTPQTEITGNVAKANYYKVTNAICIKYQKRSKYLNDRFGNIRKFRSGASTLRILGTTTRISRYLQSFRQYSNLLVIRGKLAYKKRNRSRVFVPYYLRPRPVVLRTFKCVLEESTHVRSALLPDMRKSVRASYAGYLQYITSGITH